MCFLAIVNYYGDSSIVGALVTQVEDLSLREIVCLLQHQVANSVIERMLDKTDVSSMRRQ